jgi:hypothetical protein
VGPICVHVGRPGCKRTEDDLTSAGLDLRAITTGLEHEGVTSFCASYRGLLEGIVEQAEQLGFTLDLPALPATTGEDDHRR